jgi:hypothetical protein
VGRCRTWVVEGEWLRRSPVVVAKDAAESFPTVDMPNIALDVGGGFGPTPVFWSTDSERLTDAP